MNKKGLAFHWIIFGVLVVIATFMVAITDQNLGTGPRGLWHNCFIWAFQDAERDLLALDTEMKSVVIETKEEMESLNYIPKDFGCGFLERGTPSERVPLLNKPTEYCDLNVAGAFLEDFETNLANPSYEVKLIGKEVVGITEERKIVTSSEDEAKTAGYLLFSSDNFLAKPFYLNYEYNLGFRMNVGTSFLEFLQAGRAVPRLVNACQGKTGADLETCIVDNLPDARWDAYTDCIGDPVGVYNDVVVFCFDGDEDWRYSFAVDFN